MIRKTVLSLGVVILLWLCVIAGCEKTSRPPQTGLSLSSNQVTLVQGFGETISTGGVGAVDQVEGQKDGVTATIKNGFINVNAAKDAKVGQIDLIVKKADNSALLKVTVKEPVSTGAWSVMAHPRVEVEQGQEVTAPYFIAKPVKGDISITQGQDGLNARVESGETNYEFKVIAASDAKPGVQELTIKVGNDTHDTLRVTVKPAKK